MAKNKTANCIAAGYEFTCPHCGALNKLIEYPKETHCAGRAIYARFCSYCGGIVELTLPEHAVE